MVYRAAISVATLALVACAPGSPATETVTVTATHTAAGPTATVTAAAPQAPPVPADAVTVTAVGECITLDPADFADYGDDGGYVMTVEFRCGVTASDPRASGDEAFTLVATVADPTVGGTCELQDASMVTATGAWRGSGRCMMDMAGVLAAASYVEPMYFGEVDFEGEGDFAGLVYRFYLAGTQGELAHVGWIAAVP